MKTFSPLSERILYFFLLPTVPVALLSGDRRIWIPVCLLAAVGLLVQEIRLFIARRKKKKLAHTVVDMLNMTSQKRLVEFPLPVVISDEKGDILWYNETFIDAVGEEAVIPLFTVRQLDATILENRITELEFNGRFYSAYRDCYKFSEHREMFIFYLFDTTDYYLLHKEHELSRPVVAHLIVEAVGQMAGTDADARGNIGDRDLFGKMLLDIMLGGHDAGSGLTGQSGEILRTHSAR